MHPFLVDLGLHDLPILGRTHLALPTYGVLFALGVLLAWFWFTRRARSLGVDAEQSINLVFYAVLAGLVGAKLALIALDWRYYVANPRAILETIRSAGVLAGGILAGALAFVAYARRHSLPVLRLGDAVAAPLALAQAVGRLGCFTAGCCYGVPAPGLWCAVTFTSAEAAERTGVPLGVPLVPVQLIQMANDLALAAVLSWLWNRPAKRDGTVFWWYVLLYSATRGAIEFWRGDASRGLFFGGVLSTSQLFALGGIVLAGAMLISGRFSRGAAAAR